MERLTERVAAAEKALAAFQEVMAILNPSTIERDAAIQRFEFTFEAVWKAAKQMLLEIEGIDVGSPKGVVRACREVGLLDEAQAIIALQMADDRNLTVHTYNETLAEEIFHRMKDYVGLMAVWIKKIKERKNEPGT